MSTSSISQQIVVVPHTHWDREWYEPHDVFRLRLVHMVDGLLDLLERYPEYRFTLDGQAAAIDDYLEMRPEARPRVERAVQTGQLAVGPFLILLDEFCCDGETIIRNLELGIRSARQLGQEMRVGYLPDMFGHVAQTPQILSRFGIKDASLWRGVPAVIGDHAFEWKALDGQSVRCQYLFDGYGNGLDLFAIKGQLPMMAREYIQKTSSWYNGDDVLAMLGSDHTAPYPDLIERIAEATTDSSSPGIRVETIEGYVNSVRSDRKLPVSRGELRSHARGNLLPGVFSIRTNMKQSMATAERDVAIAERLDVMFPNEDHQSFLDKAWYRIVESTAHDSVTGCGVDETAEQVVTRLHAASHIAKGVKESALKAGAKDVSADDYLVVNPSAYARLAQVEYFVAGDDPTPVDAQIVAEMPTTLGDEVMTAKDLVKILRRIHGRELFGQQINSYQWGENELRFDVAEVPVGEFNLAEFTKELEAQIAKSDPAKQWHILTIAAPRRKFLVQTQLSGLGVALASQNVALTDRVSASATGLKNEALRITINPDGTANIYADGFQVNNAFVLMDEGDRGDSYNYGPVAKAAPIGTPTEVAVSVLEAGPLRGKIKIDRVYDLPLRVDPENRDRRIEDTEKMSVSTILELRANEKILRVEISLTNSVCDHRLRVMVPTGERQLSGSCSAGQYGVTEREREAEGGWGEFPLPTFPATQFVNAGKTTVIVDKLTEYEVVASDAVSSSDLDDQLALTLIRSVGMMSVNVHPLRDEPAGSEIPVPGAQYLGTEVVTRFAVLPSLQGWLEVGAVRETDLFRFPALVGRGQAPIGTESVLPTPAVQMETRGDVTLSSLRLRCGDDAMTMESRFVNYAAQQLPLACLTDRQWTETNLEGQLIDQGLKIEAEVFSCVEIPASAIVTFSS